MFQGLNVCALTNDIVSFEQPGPDCEAKNTLINFTSDVGPNAVPFRSLFYLTPEETMQKKEA